MILDPYTWHRLAITTVVRESPQAVSIAVQRPPGYDFAPGQHAVVRVTLPSGGRLMRQYSFASAPSDNTLWFTVIKTADGAVSTWFVDAATPGDRIEISQPFTGPLAQDLSIVTRCTLIAGGSGIAPIMSHLRTLRTLPKPPQVSLLYTTRRDTQCYKDELLAHAHETIDGRLTDISPRFDPDEIRQATSGANVVLVCGSRQFVAQLRRILDPVVASDRIYSEAFSL